MMDFVHLHLHTEYSLLDGACRIDEVLDQAVKLKMPAIAVTEHGNLFSSVIFHDHARARGVKPILGCEVYVAPGDRRNKSGNPGETQNHLVLLAETLEGYHNLIKLVSAGYTEGFYYKPRIDKDLLAQHSKGLDWPELLPERRSRGRPVARPGTEGAGGGRGVPRHPRTRQLLPRDAVARDRGAADGQRRAAGDGAGPRPAAHLHQRRALPREKRTPIPTTSCSASGPARPSAIQKRLRYEAQQFFLKTAAEMAAAFGDHPEALLNTVRIAERCNVVLPEGQNHLPNFDVPAGFTLDDVLRARGARRVQAASAAAAAAGGCGRADATPSTSTNAVSPTKSR